MSSSTTPSNSSTLGQCVVCGKETKIGCSRCSASGIDWMYFCSVDHQRLIWKFHKRVCGKNPFEWPPLTEEEAEEAWNIRNWPYSPLFGETWLERLMGATRQAKPEALGGTEGEEGLAWMEVHFKELMNRVQKPQTDPTSQSVLTLLRESAFTVKVTSAFLNSHSESRLFTFSTGVQRFVLKDALGFAVYMLEQCEPPLPDDLRTSTTLNHRLIILVSLLVVQMEEEMKRGVAFDTTDNPHVVHASSALRSLGPEDLSKSHPEQGRKALSALLENLATLNRNVVIQ